MNIKKCHNNNDFRQLAQQRLPSPLFHYIDGGAEDEITLRRNTTSFNDVSLIPNILADLTNMDISTTILGQKIALPFFLAPTGMSRLFHHDGERAVSKAAEKFDTYYSLSTLSTVSIEEIGKHTNTPKCFQLYVHKDRQLTYDFIERCKTAKFSALALTVDTLVAGNRERDLRSGMVMPPKLNMQSMLSFILHWQWAFNYMTHEKFSLANVQQSVEAGTNKLTSVIDYINNQFDPSVTWEDVAEITSRWNGPFAIKGVMSVNDAKRAVDAGASAIMISNHGGRQLDGAVAPFDVLESIVDAVGGEIEIILDGGIRRGSHILKAIAMGANACSIGRAYLYGLAAGGQVGVEQVMLKLKQEIERDMILMGCANLKQLKREQLHR